MKRKDFFKSYGIGSTWNGCSTVLSAKKTTFNSTYDKMIDQVGLNFTNNESKTTTRITRQREVMPTTDGFKQITLLALLIITILKECILVY